MYYITHEVEMFTIQYEAINGEQKLQEFDTRDRKTLFRHLASFSAPILAVYEQASPITKTAQSELRTYFNLSRHARDFAFSSHV